MVLSFSFNLALLVVDEMLTCIFLYFILGLFSFNFRTVVFVLGIVVLF